MPITMASSPGQLPNRWLINLAVGTIKDSLTSYVWEGPGPSGDPSILNYLNFLYDKINRDL